MKTLTLEGSLAEKYGAVHVLGKSVKSFKDALNLVAANRPGFKEELTRLARDGVDFIVKTGEKESLDEKEICMNIPAENGYTLIPVPAGSGAIKEVFKIIVGVVLIVVGFVTQNYWLAAIGVSLVSSGLANLLMPEVAQDANQTTSEDSYLFRGAADNSKEGDPVPLLYGRLRVAGRPISLEVINGEFNAS